MGALIERYRGSREVLSRRLPHRRDGLANVRGIGRMTWRDVAGIIRDCAESDSLTWRQPTSVFTPRFVRLSFTVNF